MILILLSAIEVKRRNIFFQSLFMHFVLGYIAGMPDRENRRDFTVTLYFTCCTASCRVMMWKNMLASVFLHTLLMVAMVAPTRSCAAQITTGITPSTSDTSFLTSGGSVAETGPEQCRTYQHS